jgi:hypothetical protein
VSGLVVDDPQDLDEAEGGSQATQGRVLVRSTSAMARARYRRGGLSGSQVQVDAAALELELVVILGRVVQWPCEQRCCVMDGVLNRA